MNDDISKIFINNIELLVKSIIHIIVIKYCFIE